jgi:ADP-heptose:LPS heptosyltransferase
LHGWHLVAEPSFEELRKMIEQSHAVVSADSLGTHLAAYIERPVFISSPYDKTRFWLPPDAAANDYWGLFSEPAKLISSFDRFLTKL